MIGVTLRLDRVPTYGSHGMPTYQGRGLHVVHLPDSCDRARGRGKDIKGDLWGRAGAQAEQANAFQEARAIIGGSVHTSTVYQSLVVDDI